MNWLNARSSKPIKVNFTRGQTILLVTKDPPRTLKGVFHRHDQMRSTVVLKHVTTLPSDGKITEQLELDLQEIKDISSVVASGDLPLESSGTAIESQQSLLAPKKVTSPEKGNDTNKTDVKKERSDVSHELTDKTLQRVERTVNNYILIDELDTTFKNALDHLSQHNIIAISGEGSSQGRNGLIGIFGLAVSNAVYLVDLISLGERAFTADRKRLKQILESKDVLKVVHNCRLLSDCLMHRYSVKLSNVYDTQVMHAVITRYRTCSFPSTAGTLSDLLAEHLSFPRDMFETERAEIDKWRRRPVDETFAETAAWRVSVLLPLRKALENALYAPFDRFCELFLDVVRRSDAIEAQLHMHKDSVLPKEMTNTKKGT